MKKRIIAVILAAAVLFSLCSCTKSAPVKVNSAKIGSGVYAYFTDLAKRENKDFSDAQIKSAADEMLIRYVAVNSEFQNRGLDLTLDEKAALSSTVNSYWHLFSAYYEDIGVTKQDIYKIEQSKSFENHLMEIYYSADGDSPVSDDELKEYFNNNFVAFRAATGFLTTVDEGNNTVSLDDAEKIRMLETFNRMANEINEGVASIDNASDYVENVTVTEETIVIERSDTRYPEGFFDNIVNIGVGGTASFTVGDYIFAVLRQDITSEELNLFESYKFECLHALKGEEFNKIVESWTESYKIN